MKLPKFEAKKTKENVSCANCIPRDFSERKLKVCPICKQDVKEWQIASSWTVLDRLYEFTCPNCGSILIIGQNDITGLSYTAMTLCGQMKKMKNKEMREIYVKCKRVGKNVDKKYLQGEEFILSELYDE
ncbi:MAG: hypothetical protein SPI74_05805 [Eubacterium sp.]|nr:hypothetical protein [Eubacterium sp.]